MSTTLIVLAGLIYLFVSIEQAIDGNWPMAIVFLCYAGANAGLALQAK